MATATWLPELPEGVGVMTKQVTYRYDVYDRRIAKDVDDNGDGTADRGEWYVYDGDRILFRTDRGGAVTNRYLHGPQVDQVFADESTVDGLLWALADHQGTVHDWADYASGTNSTTVSNHLKYDAFGNITAQSSGTHEPLFAFTGREWDADAELYYYRARWYDPAVGEFASEDRVGFAAGDANLGRYVGNGPTNYVDPSGLTAVPAWPSYLLPGQTYEEYWASMYAALALVPRTDGSGFHGDWLDISANVAAGAGDAASMGATDILRGWLGINDGIDHDSGYYATGEWGYTAIEMVGTAGAAGVLKSGVRVVGKEAMEEVGERMAREAGERQLKANLNVLDGCFVAGTLVVVDGAADPATAVVDPATVEGDNEEPGWSVGLVLAASAVVTVAVIGRPPKRADDRSRRGKRHSAPRLPEGRFRLLDADGRYVAETTPDDLRRIDGTGMAGTVSLPAQLGSCSTTATAASALRRRTPPAAWMIGCAAAALFGFLCLGLESPSSARVEAVPAVTAGGPAVRPIESVRIGDVVRTDTPHAEDDRRLGTRIDPPSWRSLTLRAPKIDGSFADVTLLRPLSWLAERNAAVGGMVRITVPECGIDGDAIVLAVGPCPDVAQLAPGHAIVTGTYRHASADVLDLSIAGIDDPIGVTGVHPFWSEDRQEFVRADALAVGERVQTLAGPAAVTAITRRGPPEPVFNLEVMREHVFRVGTAGVLVHNGDCPDLWSRAPKNLVDQMALDAAKNGAGRRIITDLGDPRFKGMEKWEYKVKTARAGDSVIHYVRDPATGALMDFKFTKHYDPPPL